MIRVGTFKDCALTRDKISLRSRRDSPGLKTVILPSYVLAHQFFAIRLLGFIVGLFEKCSGFRALFAELAFSVCIYLILIIFCYIILFVVFRLSNPR